MVGRATAVPSPMHGETATWPLDNDECCVSIDIEAGGPIPGLNPMLSLGAVVFTGDGAPTDTVTAARIVSERDHHPRGPIARVRVAGRFAVAAEPSRLGHVENSIDSGPPGSVGVEEGE